ncbi:hypothetical protein [Streptomyces sp. XH2]|uniref:hypothetical protein n=1 Tax=Streptomyces sp. XH2 TaxID=3412483 RepID=UPI003C7D6046
MPNAIGDTPTSGTPDTSPSSKQIIDEPATVDRCHEDYGRGAAARTNPGQHGLVR